MRLPMWSDYTPKPSMGNGHTHCCGFEPMLRVNKENYKIHFECRICPRKGCEAYSMTDAGFNWEDSAQRAVKYENRNRNRHQKTGS